MLAMVRDAMPEPLSRFSTALPDKATPRDLIPRRFPGFARNTQHRAFSRSGITDDKRKIVAIGDMCQRVRLLTGKDKTTRLGAR